MRVLIACESSGESRDAFRRLGHDAWSCDLQAADDGSPYHFQCDVRHLFHVFPPFYWDLVIAHPDCTYLCISGLHWNKRVPGRAQKTEDALKFVQWLMGLPVHRYAIENPVGCISTRIRPADQYIQPYEFGEDASKKTGLWLKNLPLLPIDPAKRFAGRRVIWNGKEVERWSNQTDSGNNALSDSADRWKIRSRTYSGIARAFAETWGTK